jgi:MFS family permease
MGVFSAGTFLGAPFNTYIMDKWGRKPAQVTGAILIIIGSIITSTSMHLAQFVVGRFILGAGSAFAQSAPAVSTPCGAFLTPKYAVEIARPTWRGRCAAMYNCGWYAGAIPAAAITFGTSYINNNLCWQLPLIFQ